MPTSFDASLDEDRKSDPREALIDMAVDGWRLSKVFAKVLGKVDPSEAGRYINQLRYFQRKIDETLAKAGLSLVSIEGQPFDIGMAASALNTADFGPEDLLEVDQMLEPIVMGPSGVLRSGTVLLRKIEK